jgi:hypothetical protein
MTLPTIVNGRIDRPGDEDVFAFEVSAGEVIVAEVMSRRLDSPLDSALRLVDAAGKQIAFNDDHEDKGAALHTHHADAYLRVKLPAGGQYRLHLTDVQRNGGPEYGYRLRISHPRPDFALRIAPSSINIRPGSTANATVFALRKDGFAGQITLSLQDAPAGVQLSDTTIPLDKESVMLKLRAPARGLDQPVVLHLQGTAVIDGRTIVRRAVPADDMMQAFIYRHLVCAQDLMLMTIRRAPNR